MHLSRRRRLGIGLGILALYDGLVRVPRGPARRCRGARGGAVTIFVAGGCSSYDGTTKNGVTTSSWASFSHSFGFAFPLPACADGKKPAKQ